MDQQPLAITHANVLPMGSDEVLPDHTVVIESGVIRAVEHSGQVDTNNMKVVTAEGKYLLPGLADMHVHYWEEGESALYLANGVTTVRNMEGTLFHFAFQRKVSRKEMAGPRLVTTSPFIDGSMPNGEPFWPRSVLLTDPDKAEAIVEGFVAMGFQQIKAYSYLSYDVLCALGSAARDAGVRLVGHCPNDVTWEQAMDAGMSSFDHLGMATWGHERDDAGPPPAFEDTSSFYTFLAEQVDEKKIRVLAQRMADEGVWSCPTTTVWSGTANTYIFDDARAQHPVQYIYRQSVQGWRRSDGADPETRAALLRWNDRRLELVGVMHEEGVPLLAGTDANNPFVIPGFSLHDELDAFVHAGLSPYEAIRSATTDAARFLGEQYSSGSVAVGQRADMIVVNGNPLEDIRALRQPTDVFTNGFHFDRAELDAMLAHRITEVGNA